MHPLNRSPYWNRRCSWSVHPRLRSPHCLTFYGVLVIAFIGAVIAFRIAQTRASQRRNLTYVNTSAVAGAVPPAGYYPNAAPVYYSNGPEGAPQYYPQPGYGPQYPPQSYNGQPYAGQNAYYSVGRPSMHRCFLDLLTRMSTASAAAERV